ncbi:hypothetical protein CC79DRAFT_1326229 [Sarocladium strictum]
MSSHLKSQVSASDFEADTVHSAHGISPTSRRARMFRLLDATRLTLTLVALACGIVILGVSADALMVYKGTHLPEEFNLPLWPQAFNVNPTVAMVAAGTVIVAANSAVLLVSKVSMLRSSVVLTTTTNLLAPTVSFTLALIATIFHFAVSASKEVDTVESWSCRWRHAVMIQEPHFGTLCKQSRAGVGLVVALVPLEVVVAFVTVCQIVLAKTLRGNVEGARRKGGSPVPS